MNCCMLMPRERMFVHLEHYESPDHENAGTGVDHTIKRIADTVTAAVSYAGEIRWDSTNPDGTTRKFKG